MEFLMRKPLHQLFLSIVLSALGTFLLLFLRSFLGLELMQGMVVESTILIGVLFLVLFTLQTILQPIIGRDFSFPRVFSSGPREEGTVKWFNATKGFGFITPEDGDDVFVHYRSIRGNNRYMLREGMEVSYVLGSSGKGPQAEDVDLLEDSEYEDDD